MIQIGWANIGCLYDGTIVAPDWESALESLTDFLLAGGLNPRRVAKIARELQSEGVYYFSPIERYLLCMGDFIELGGVPASEAQCD